MARTGRAGRTTLAAALVVLLTGPVGARTPQPVEGRTAGTDSATTSIPEPVDVPFTPPEPDPAVAAEAQGRVLVQLAPGATVEQAVAELGFDPAAVEARFGTSGFALRVDDAGRAALDASPLVAGATDDGVVTIADEAPANVVLVRAPEAHAEGATGAGARVAIVDTGVDATHPDLAGNMRTDLGKDCVDDLNGSDPHGHGTHVAGTVAAVADGVGVLGVAPGAELVPVRVLSASGSGTWAQVACGLQHVLDLVTDADPTNDIDVVNMSLGGGGSSPATCDGSVLRSVICRLTDEGVVVVVAAGNSSADAATFVPAAFPEVVTVSALDGRTMSQASFSNYGAGIEITAPGVNVTSTYRAHGYAALSGTSMASPAVAGSVAVLKGGHPDWGRDQILALLRAEGMCPDRSRSGPDGCVLQGEWPGDRDAIAEPLVDVGSAALAGLPGTRIVAPRDGARLAGSTDVVVHASSGSTVRVRIDEGPWVDAAPVVGDPALWSWTWNTNGDVDGPHVVGAEITATGAPPEVLTRSVTVDNGPVVVIRGPAGPTVSGPSTAVRADAASPGSSSEALVVTWQAGAAGGPMVHTSGARFEATWATGLPPDGPVSLSVTVTDPQGRSRTATWAPIQVDNRPSVTQDFAEVHGPSRVVVHAWSPLHPETSLRPSLVIDGTGIPLTHDGSAFVGALDGTTWTQGGHYGTLSVTDPEGRTRSTSTHVWVDNSPTITWLRPTGDVGGVVEVAFVVAPLGEPASTATVTATVAGVAAPVTFDTTSGEHRLTVDTRGRELGTIRVDVAAVDGAGRRRTASKTLWVDQRPRVNSVVPWGGTIGGTVTVEVRATDATTSRSALVVAARIGDEAPMTLTYDPVRDAHTTTWDTTTRPDGPLTMTITATDADGFSGTSQAAFTVANNPRLTLYNPVDGATADADLLVDAYVTSIRVSGDRITLTASIDGQTPVAITRRSSYGSFSSWISLAGLSDGNHTIAVTAVDDLGGSTTVDRGFAVRHAPVVALDTSALYAGVVDLPIAASSLSYPTASLTVGLTAGSATYAAAYDPGTGRFLARVDTQLLPDGQVPVRVTATDPGGLTTSIDRLLSVGNSPVVGIGGWGTTGVGGRVRLCFMASDRTDPRASIDVRYTIDGGASRPTTYVPTAIPPLNCDTLDTSTLADGTHQLVVTATDPGGKRGTASQALPVDNRLEAAVLNPAPASVGSPPADVEAVGRRYGGGGSEDLTVTYRLDGGPARAMTRPQHGVGIWRAPLSPVPGAGSHTVQVTVVDDVSRRSTVATSTFVVPGPPPLVASVIAPTAAGPVRGIVRVDATVAGGALAVDPAHAASAWYRIDTGAWASLRRGADGFVGDWDTRTATVGLHRLEVIAVDFAGGVANSSVEVTVARAAVPLQATVVSFAPATLPEFDVVVALTSTTRPAAGCSVWAWIGPGRLGSTPAVRLTLGSDGLFRGRLRVTAPPPGGVVMVGVVALDWQGNQAWASATAPG